MAVPAYTPSPGSSEDTVGGMHVGEALEVTMLASGEARGDALRLLISDVRLALRLALKLCICEVRLALLLDGVSTLKGIETNSVSVIGLRAVPFDSLSDACESNVM